MKRLRFPKMIVAALGRGTIAELDAEDRFLALRVNRQDLCGLAVCRNDHIARGYFPHQAPAIRRENTGVEGLRLPGPGPVGQKHPVTVRLFKAPFDFQHVVLLLVKQQWKRFADIVLVSALDAFLGDSVGFALGGLPVGQTGGILSNASSCRCWAVVRWYSRIASITAC